MATATGNNAGLVTQAKTAIDVKKPTTNKGLKSVLDKFKTEIATALPLHLKDNAEKYARQLVTLHSSNSYLQRCSVESMLGSLMTASALGLDLSPQLGQCYIIPYGTQAQFQLGYKGMIDLANRSGQIIRIYADVVYEKDHFEYSKGLDGTLKHEESDEEDRGKPTHVYALAQFKNGGYAFDVWTWNRVMAHGKKHSQSFTRGSSPWQSDPESMAKKTLLKSIWKYLPISTEIQRAAVADEAVRVVNDTIEAEAEILDTPDFFDAEANDVPETENKE